MGWLVGFLLATVVPLGAAAFVVALTGFAGWMTLRRRRYAWFRLIDAEGAPLAGAEVYRWLIHFRSPLSPDLPLPHDPWRGTGFGRLAVDDSGAVRHVFWPFGAQALYVRGPGLDYGLVNVLAVAEYGAFPTEPYVCTVRMGMLAPPARSSPLLRGLAPGQRDETCTAYVNLHEKPAPGDVWVGWPTLEAAVAHNQSGSFARYWKVDGIRNGAGIGSGSFGVEVRSAERVRAGASEG